MVAVGCVVGVAVAEAVGVALGGTGVTLGRTAVGAARPLAWVGLGCALGVGVGAADAEDGSAPSTAAAKAARKTQTRIRWADSKPIVRRSAASQAKISAPRQLQLAARCQTMVVALAPLSQGRAGGR